MEKKFVKASSCPDLLLFKREPLPQLDMETPNGAAGDVAGTVKPTANVHEFVSPKEEENSSKKFPNVHAKEFVPRQKEAMTQVNADELEPLPEEEMMKLPSAAIKVGDDSQVILLNDREYMIVPSLMKSKDHHHEPAVDCDEEIVSSDESLSYQERFFVSERRRQVALDALRLVEQRRARPPSFNPGYHSDGIVVEPPKPVHLSRSPIRYTPEERHEVNVLRYVKRERVKRILREMSEEREQEQEQQQNKDSTLSSSSFSPQSASSSISPPSPISPSPPPPPQLPPLQFPSSSSSSTAVRRYIPTDKEWDQQRRAKALAKREAKKKARREARQAKVARNGATPSQENTMEKPLELAREMPVKRPTDIAMEKPLEMVKSGLGEVPLQIQAGDSRNGMRNKWTYPANLPPRVPPSIDNGKIVRRYTMEELRELQLQPEELETPCLDKKALSMGCMYY